MTKTEIGLRGSPSRPKCYMLGVGAKEGAICGTVRKGIRVRPQPIQDREGRILRVSGAGRESVSYGQGGTCLRLAGGVTRAGVQTLGRRGVPWTSPVPPGLMA